MAATSKMGQGAERRQEDLALVRRCIGGDAAAWAELVRRFEPTVYFALQRSFRIHGVDPGPAQLEERVAEVFFRLVRDDFARLRSFQGRSSLASWLQVISGNFVIDLLRKRRPDLSLDDPKWEALRYNLPDPAPAPDTALERDEARALLGRLIDHLGPADRRFAKLHFRDDLSFDEVAQAMGTTVGAVYGRKRRVRRKLVQLLRQHELSSKHRR